MVITEILVTGALSCGILFGGETTATTDEEEMEPSNYVDYLDMFDEEDGDNTAVVNRRDEIIKTVVGERDALDDEVDVIVGERDALEDELVTLEEENVTLKQGLEATSVQVETGEAKYSELEKEVVRLKSELKKAEAKKAKSEKKKQKPVSVKEEPKEESESKAESPKTEEAPLEKVNHESKSAVKEESKATPTKSKASGGQTFQATYYTAFCDTGCSGVTADGTDVSNTTTKNGRGIIATDPSVIPLGTVVSVDGTEYVSADTGGNIKGKRIDILVASKSDARSKGRHDANVKLLN